MLAPTSYANGFTHPQENLISTQAEKDSSQLQLIELEKESHTMNNGLKEALKYHNVCKGDLKTIMVSYNYDNTKLLPNNELLLMYKINN